MRVRCIQSFASCAPAGFWQELAKLKVDVLGLDQKPLVSQSSQSVAWDDRRLRSAAPAGQGRARQGSILP